MKGKREGKRERTEDEGGTEGEGGGGREGGEGRDSICVSYLIHLLLLLLNMLMV